MIVLTHEQKNIKVHAISYHLLLSLTKKNKIAHIDDTFKQSNLKHRELVDYKQMLEFCFWGI